MPWQKRRTPTPADRARKARYDSPEHRAAKEQFRRQVAAGLAYCWRCGQHIPPGTPCGRGWQTGHDDTGTVIMGPEHTRCNSSDGASRGAQVANANRKTQRLPRRQQQAYSRTDW